MTYTLSKERQVRIWFPAPPENTIVSLASISACRKIEHLNSRPITRHSVAIELLIPLGGRFLYGLLGAEASGALATELSLITYKLTDEGTVFTDSLAGTLDLVRWGLPGEYVNAVLDGASAGIDKYGMPAAETIRFHVAAFGEVGSTASVFQRLASMIVALLIGEHGQDFDIQTELERILDAKAS